MKPKNSGKIILKSVEPEKETEVISYLAGLFKKASRDKIETLVQKTPIVLIKGIPEPRAQTVVAELRQLGGNAEFISASSTEKSSSETSPARPDKRSPPPPAPSRTKIAEQASCSQCGNRYSREDMLFYNDMWVCAACKPTFVQQIRESGKIDGQLNYAGFWIRFGAKFIDGIITGVISFLIAMIPSLLSGILGSDPSAMINVVFSNVISIIFSAIYSTWFIGKFAATPGKMACGLKIVMADGDRVSFGRALGRHFAEWISSMIFLIGYIMAAFDDEKRTLHDRICNTRVVIK